MADVASAQQGPGSDPDGAQGFVKNVFHSPSVDSINLYNGQLTIPIAIGPRYPIGPNLSYQLTLTYNSRFLEFGRPNIDPPQLWEVIAGDPAIGIGWTFTLGKIARCGDEQSQTCYFSRDGAEHRLDQPDGASFYKTTDGTQFRLYAPNGLGAGPYTMWDGDGNAYAFSWQVTGYDDPALDYRQNFGRGRDGWYLTSLADPFGNGLTVSYYSGVSPCWTAPAHCGGGPSMRCTGSANTWIPQVVTLPSGTIAVSLNGNQMIGSFTFPVIVDDVATTRTWSLEYQTEAYPPPPVCFSRASTLWKVSRIVLPSDVPGSPSYQFVYSQSGALGLLSSMTLPTGATVSYSYAYYTFFHGRTARLPPGCAPAFPPSGVGVQVVGSTSSPSGPGPTPPAQPTSLECNPDTQERYEDFQLGVVRRTELVSGVSAVTDYVQYAFPFGERGSTPPPGRNDSQTLTVVVFPLDIDGRRRAKGVLFWSAEWDGAPSLPGDRTGADIEERVYDSDPTVYGAISMPVCGGASPKPFCSNNAVRVTKRTFEYTDQFFESLNRRLQSETTFYQAAQPDGTCPGCPFHGFSFSNLAGRTWEGNGRNYNIEAHSGNLGNDGRTITTYWLDPPTVPIWLPNLFDRRTRSDITLLVDGRFEFNTSNGFMRGSWTYTPERVLLKCNYGDGNGNLRQEFSATFTEWPERPNPPRADACSANFPSMPPVGDNGDRFGKAHEYVSGLLVSTRWINGFTQMWPSVDYTRDPSTGWITRSRDTAGFQTEYRYDSIGRVTSIDPPGVEVATSVSYPTPNQTVATRNGGAGLFTSHEYFYDGLGRLIRERRLMPDSQYVKRFSKYDAAGNAHFTSEWVPDATSETIAPNQPTQCTVAGGPPYTAARPTAAPGTYQLCYDPFGRPRQIVGSNHSSLVTIHRSDESSFYSDTIESVTTGCVNGPLLSDGNCGPGGFNSTTISRRDAFGRIVGVSEPDGALTQYSYDVNDKLRFISQPPSQTRSFGYDPLGFLRSETTPEKGTVTYSEYGSLGNLLQKIEAGVVHSYNYDFAGRLLSESAGGSTYASHSYDAGGFSGKLTRRVGQNPLSSPPGTVTEDFTYSGLGGRLSQKAVSVTGAPAFVPVATQTWSYNSLGLPEAHGHPRAGALPDIVSTLQYSNGQPVGLVANSQQVLSAATYHPSGALASWTAGNGIVTTIAQDPSLLPRPSQIFTSAGGFNTGAYTYDGAGNIKAMGDDSFNYDIHSRLSSSAVSGQSRSYPYDRYGNLNPVGVNPATNRLLAGSYDAMGNLTAFAGKSYAYDALSRQTSLDSGAERYLYDGGNERIAKMAQVAPPNDAAFVSQDVPTTMITGQTYQVFVEMRNTGTNTWTHQANYRLGSQAPPDNTRWGLNRAFLDVADRIDPGQTKLFRFFVTAPTGPGFHAFQWRMLREGDTWFGDFTPLLQINVVPDPNAAAFVSRNFPNPMQAGSRYWVEVTMRNTGTATWTAAVNYKLGSQAPEDNTTWGFNRVPLQPSDSIASGQAKQFLFTVTAPSTPGTYTFRWRMIQEGVGWFGDLTPLDSISVVDDPGTTADFHSVPGCRLLDTRGGPPLTAGVPRNLQITGSCAVPAGATAVSGSLVVLETTHTGVMQIWPTHLSPGDASFQNLTAGMLRANNFVVGLSPAGQFSVVAYLPQTGTTHIIVDISGYFRPPGLSAGEGFPGPAIPLPPACPQCDRTGSVPEGTTPTTTTPLAPVETWSVTFRDEANRLSTDYLVNPSSLTRTKDYLYFGNLLVATWEAALGYRYYASDHLGTPRLVTNPSGGVVEEHKYHPFGEQLLGTFGNQPLKFAAMERDPSSNSDYDHARYCSPLQGRFLSPDPVIQARRALRKPQLWNRYAYALNNPLKYVDPTGRVLELPDDEEKRRKALRDLRNTVPVELRMFVRTTTQNGKTTLDPRYLSMMRGSSSGNFQALRTIANSPGTLVFNSSATSVQSRAGTEAIGANAAAGGITVPSGTSLSGKLEVYTGGDLNAREAAETTAHELRHGKLFLLGRPALDEWITTITQTPTGMNMEFRLDPNGPVNIETKAAEREAVENFDPFVPPND